MIVAFTGHRPVKLGAGYSLYNPTKDKLVAKLTARLTQLRKEHPNLRCISGMALGFDQWAAELCVKLGIPFEAAIPFDGQEFQWSNEARDIYMMLLMKAKKIHIVSAGGYSSIKMQKRNVWMVDHCDLLIAAWNGSPGGTYNCIRYAKSVGRTWENLFAVPVQ